MVVALYFVWWHTSYYVPYAKSYASNQRIYITYLGDLMSLARFKRTNWQYPNHIIVTFNIIIHFHILITALFQVDLSAVCVLIYIHSSVVVTPILTMQSFYSFVVC